MITIDRFIKSEWRRFAASLPAEHTVRIRCEAIADLPVGTRIGVVTYYELAAHYRAWLVFGTVPPSHPLVSLF